MSTTPLLTALLALFLATACKPTAELQVDYKDLGYEAGLFTHGGNPFTGRTLQYWGDGTLKSDWEMRDGLNHGVSKEFNEAGQQLSETNFVAGKHHGDNRYWDAEGNLIKHQVYDMDKEVSVEFFGSLAEDPE